MAEIRLVDAWKNKDLTFKVKGDYVTMSGKEVKALRNTLNSLLYYAVNGLTPQTKGKK